MTKDHPKAEKRLIRRQRIVPDPKYTLTPEPGQGTSYMPLPRDHPCLALVGDIAMRWAFIEHLLDSCIGELADLRSEITTCITAQMMGHTPRCLTIKAIAHWRGLPDIVKAAERLNNALYEASELRNRAVHDRLLFQEATDAIYKEHRMSKKELSLGLKPYDPQELERTLKIIDSKRDDCVNLLNLIREQVYEWYT